ncbi:hypothetical protein BH11PSE7_BH11PSE7_17770 [soil metagenome]
MNLTRFFKAATSAVITAAVLTACGGGDSAPAANAGASVSGTAATGAAIASGTVTLKCVSGTTSAATTGTDGSFTVDVSSVTLPCVARVEYKNALGATVQLHSVVTAAGTANITPLTDLLVAKLASSSAASAFDTFTATTGRALTAAQIKTAADAVKAYLVTLGVDVTNFPADPIGTKFVAKNASTDGDATDKLLDALKTKLGTKSITDAETEINSAGSTGTSTGSVGCTGDALAFFTKNAGTYPSTASSFGGSGTVAGIANGGAATVVIGADCTVKVGDASLKYQDGSLSPSPGGQIDVSLTGTNFSFSTYEVYGDGTGLTSLHDTRTDSYMNFFLPKK